MKITEKRAEEIALELVKEKGKGYQFDGFDFLYEPFDENGNEGTDVMYYLIRVRDKDGTIIPHHGEHPLFPAICADGSLKEYPIPFPT